MSAFSGPEISTSGLIFCYDANNTEKSWKGKPTTNLVNPSWAAWSVDGSGQGNIGTRTINSTYYCTISDVNQNTRQNTYIEGVSASTTYTFSVKYRKISGTPTLRFQIQAYNGGSYISTMSFATTAQLGITDKEGWQTAYITLTTPANTTRVLWFMQDGDDYTTYTHSFELKEVQMEEGSIYSPFVDGTRSNTQAILDLTNNNTITAQSLTYNSNGSFNFASASSNYMNISANTNTRFQNSYQTYSSWVNIISTGPNGYSELWNNGGNQGATIQWRSGAIGFFIYNGAYLDYPVSVTNALNTWMNITCVIDNIARVMTLYKNGVLVGTSSQWSPYTLPNGNVHIGGNFATGNGGDFTQGTISSVKIYNRALSAQEVAQNFQALRGRYGV
jgi:hypothetical protein